MNRALIALIGLGLTSACSSSDAASKDDPAGGGAGGGGGTSGSGGWPAACEPKSASNLDGISTSPSSIHLTWKDNSTNETGFRVERRSTKGSDPFVAAATLPVDATVLEDIGLNSNWEYTYRVIALGKGCEAKPSPEVVIQVQDGLGGAGGSGGTGGTTNDRPTEDACGNPIAPMPPLMKKCDDLSNAVHATPSSFRDVVASSEGKIVAFDPGDYPIGGQPLAPKSGAAYCGAGKARFIGKQVPGNDFAFFTESSPADVLFDGFVFEAAGIRIGNAAKNIQITNNTFRKFAGGGDFNGSAIVFYNSISGLKLIGNQFVESPDGWMMLGYGPDDFEVVDNVYDTFVEGMHVMWQGERHNTYVGYNQFFNARRIPIEFQTNGPTGENPGTGIVIEHNQLDGWKDVSGGGPIGISFANPGSVCAIIQKNEVICTGEGNPNGYRIGIEAAGTKLLVRDNVVEHCEGPIVYSEGCETQTIVDNTICDVTTGNGTVQWEPGCPSGNAPLLEKNNDEQPKEVCGLGSP